MQMQCRKDFCEESINMKYDGRQSKNDNGLGAKGRGGRILAILDRDLYLNENAVEMQSMKH